MDKGFENDDLVVFILLDLVKFFGCKLKEFGSKYGKVNVIWLKERILEIIFDFLVYMEGREMWFFLLFEIGGILLEVKIMDLDVVCWLCRLVRVVYVVRNEILKVKSFFGGIFFL